MFTLHSQTNSQIIYNQFIRSSYLCDIMLIEVLRRTDELVNIFNRAYTCTAQGGAMPFGAAAEITHYAINFNKRAGSWEL